MSTTGLVFDIEKFAVHDGPGIRTVVFLKGCPLSCVWCHSPESRGRDPELVFYESLCIHCGTCVRICPHGAQELVNNRRDVLRERCDNCGQCAESCPPQALELKGSHQTVEQVLREVEKDAGFYRSSGGGVTISGGEPTLQPRFLVELLRGLKERGIHTALETCGLTSPAVLRRISPLVDLFLYDVKHMDPLAHRRLTGVSNERILENLAYLASGANEIQLRVPVIPGHNDTRDNLERLGAFMRDLGLQRVALLPYNPSAGAKYRWLGRTYLLGGAEPLTHAEMEELAAPLKEQGLLVQMGA